MSELTVRPYSESLRADALALARIALGNSGAVQKSDEFWCWKHHNNPMGPSYGLTMWDVSMSRLVGLRLFMQWKFEDCNGRPIRAVRAVDTATHPEYRRQGVFSQLTQQAIGDLPCRDTKFIYNTPNGHSLRGYLKMGWRDLGKLPVYVRVLRPWSVLHGVVRATKSSPPPFGGEDAFLNWNEFESRHRRRIGELSALWEAARKRVGLRTQRTSAYFRWRFGKHPHTKYNVCEIFEQGNSGALAGFAVLRQKQRHGCRELILADLCLADTDINLGSQLMRSVVQRTRCDYVVCHFASGTFEHRLARWAGFMRVPRQGIQFATRSLNIDSDFTLPTSLQSGWDLSLADLEIF